MKDIKNKYIYNENTDGYVFWSYGNAPTQEVEELNYHEIEGKFRALYLLSEKIIGASSFYYESDITRKITKKYRSIFKYSEDYKSIGAVYFIDDKFNDFLEHGFKKIEKSPYSFLAYSDKDIVKENGEFLNNLGIALKRKEISISEKMRNLWKDDIYNSNEKSLGFYINKNITENECQNYKDILSNIANEARDEGKDFIYSYVSSKIIKYKLNVNLGGILDFVKRKLNDLYIIATAEILEVNVDSSLRSYISHYDSGIFLKCMKYMDLSNELYKLKVSELVKLKSREEFIYLRNYYFNIIDAANNQFEIVNSSFDYFISSINKNEKKIELIQSFLKGKNRKKIYRDTLDTIINVYDDILNNTEKIGMYNLLNYFINEKSIGKIIFPENRKNASHQISSVILCRILIIVALKEEMDAFIGHIDKLIKKEVIEGCNGCFFTINKNIEQIGIFEVGKGNTNSLANLIRLIQKLNPEYIILTGICAGFHESNKNNYGDVLISKRIIYYESGKINKGKTQFRPDYKDINVNILNIAAKVQNTDWYSNIKVMRPDNKKDIPQCYITDILSGEKVIADENFRILLGNEFSQAMGLEMEGYGAAFAVYKSGENIKFILIKSICDYADGNKDDIWHNYAADVSVVFTLKLIDEIIKIGINDEYR